MHVISHIKKQIQIFTFCPRHKNNSLPVLDLSTTSPKRNCRPMPQKTCLHRIYSRCLDIANPKNTRINMPNAEINLCGLLTESTMRNTATASVVTAYMIPEKYFQSFSVCTISLMGPRTLFLKALPCWVEKKC